VSADILGHWLLEPEFLTWLRAKGTPPPPPAPNNFGSTFSDGERAPTAASHRIFQWVPQRVLGSIELLRLWVGNFDVSAIGVRLDFLACPANLQLALPAASWAQGSCNPMGSSNAFFTTDSTAAPPTPTHLVPAGGAIDVDLRGVIVDPERIVQLTAATFPSDLCASLAWRNAGPKQVQGGTYIATYRAP